MEALRKAGRQKDRSMGKLQLENRTHKVGGHAVASQWPQLLGQGCLTGGRLMAVQLLLDRKDQCIKGLKEKVSSHTTAHRDAHTPLLFG